MGPRKQYHHGNVPQAMRRAARQIVDAGDIEHVGLRELARIVGVSGTAPYRHFENKEALLAAVAAEGFCELAAALRTAAAGPDPSAAVGIAYVDFALTKRGLFRLMFGPVLLQKEKHPVLDAAVAEIREAVGRSAVTGTAFHTPEEAGLAVWGLIHGVSALLIGNLLPEADARALARRIFAKVRRPETKRVS